MAGGGIFPVQGVVHVDADGEVVHEFVCRLRAFVGESEQFIDHSAAGAAGDPDIAVDNPEDVAFCFAVCTAHVPDLWVWPDAREASIFEGRVVVFHEEPDIVLWEVFDDPL